MREQPVAVGAVQTGRRFVDSPVSGGVVGATAACFVVAVLAAIVISVCQSILSAIVD